jgi:hypothetical protein
MQEQFAVETKSSSQIKIRQIEEDHTFLYAVVEFNGTHRLSGDVLVEVNSSADHSVDYWLESARKFAETSARAVGLID